LNCLYLFIQCERLQGGLQKIAEASEQLAILNDRLAVQKVAVAEKSEACEIMLEEISTGTAQATEKKSLAESKGKEIEEQNVVIAKEKVTQRRTEIKPMISLLRETLVI
jgi:dynein heavy chain